MNRWRHSFILSSVTALGLYGLFILFSDYQVTLDAVTRLGWEGWTSILILSLLNYLLRFGRWQIYLRHLDHRIPSCLHLAYYCAGFALTTTPGKAGEAIRSFYLKPHAVSYGDSLAALFAERFVDLLAMVLLATLIVTYFPSYGWLIAITSVLLILLIVPITQSRRLSHFIKARHKRHISRFDGILERLAGLLRSSAVLLGWRQLYWGLAIGIVAWGAEGLGFFIVLATLDIDVSMMQAVSIYAIGILAGALSFIPGGIGSTETVMSLLLMAMGAELATAVAATLICRIATLWFAVAIGFLALIGLEIHGYSLGRMPFTHSDTDLK
jgi:uncharacterized protein (TIRG00374 family)